MAVSISSLTPWWSNALEVTVTGSGFGSHAPYNGKSAFIELFDVSTGGDEGHTSDSVGLNVISWTDSQIVFLLCLQ